MEQKRNIYLIDTNSFITPYHMYYPFDLVPNFWRCMAEKIIDGSIVLLDKVYDELMVGGDELSTWLSGISPLTRIEHKELRIINKYSDVLKHIQTSGFYTPKALAEWSDIHVADPWLIACASVFDFILVTFELSNKNLSKNSRSSKPKIPDVCKEFGVVHKNLFDMMRALSFNIS